MDPQIQDNPMPPHEPAPQNREHVRERILRRFELWLDEILDSEQPPEGVAAEILEQLETDAPPDASGADGAACDSYALWSAVTAMAEETRLQGRAFKQLHDGLSPLHDLVGSVGDMLHRYESSLDQQEQNALEASRRAAWDDVLETLLDMRERLLRGARSAQDWLDRPRPPQEPGLMAGIRDKLLGRPDDGRATEQDEAVRSMLKGYDLCREVLDEALTRIGVRPIECLGRPFDPLTMKAIDIGYDADAPDGIVLEVYRQGYTRGEAIYRPAEVKVARRQQDAPPARSAALGPEGPSEAGRRDEQGSPLDQGEKYES